MFEGVSVQVLAARSSDHKPLLLNWENNGQGNETSKRGFKFEMSWIVEEEYQKVVEEAWHEIPTDDIQMKLIQCKTTLTN
jgi:hypothetical protein